MIHLRRLLKSFRYALIGLGYVWKTEQSFRVQVFVGAAVLGIGAWLQMSALRYVLLILLVTFVLVLEVLNTFFEKLIDIIAPKIHSYAGMLKDILAAAVFVAAAGAAAVGLLLFLPYLVS